MPSPDVRRLSTSSAFIGGIGAGLLAAALAIKLLDAEWLVVSAGALLLVLSGVRAAA